MIPDWATFAVQLLVGVGTIALAWVSFSTSRKAVNAADEANELSASSVESSNKSVEASRQSAQVAERMLNLEEERAKAARRNARRAQARQLWVSMLVVDTANGSEFGVLRIRNNSDRPVSNMRIESRGRNSQKKIWFQRDECKVPVVYPGDTIVRSREKVTDWDVPKTYFPYFEGTYHPMVGPEDDPYYVTSVVFDDADENTWRLVGGHRLEAVGQEKDD